jgi:cytochrome P450
MKGEFDRECDVHGDALMAIRKEVTANPDAKMFAFETGPLISLSLADPAYIKEFARLDATHYAKADMLEGITLIIGKSLLVNSGEKWKVLRKLSAKAFHFESLAANLQKIEATADWLYDSAENGNLEKFKTIEEFQAGTGEVVGRIFFGDNLSEYQVNGEPFTRFLTELFADVNLVFNDVWYALFGTRFVKLGLFSFHRKVVKKIKIFKKVCQQILDVHRKKNKKTEAFLQIFFDAQSDPEYSGIVTDEVIIDQFIMMALGGVDTTSHVLSLALYYLDQNPETKLQMEKEVNEFWPEGTPVDISILNNMKYMNAFIQEVIRIGGPFSWMIYRQAQKDHKLLDLNIPKGMLMSLFYGAPHMNTKYYKNPEKFDPDRFLRQDPEEGFNKEPYAFMGFGVGPRSCLGQQLAMLKAKIFLAKFVRRFEFKLPSDYKLQMNQTFIYGPREQIVAHLSPKDRERMTHT